MSVMISIIGPASSSDEFIAAEKLKRVIEETIPKDAIGGDHNCSKCNVIWTGSEGY